MKISYAIMMAFFVTAHAKKTLEIYKKAIFIPTVQGRARVQEMVDYLVTEFGGGAVLSRGFWAV